MSSPEVSVFGLDRTITDNVFRNALGDIALLGLGGPEVTSGLDMYRIAEQREVFYGWIAGKDETDIEPLLERSAVQTAERIAPWAKLVMGAEYDTGRQICIYSSVTPQELVDAYAEGIESAIPGIEIEWAFGKPMIQENGKYTGQTSSMLKATTLEHLQVTGLAIDLVADSYGTAWPAMCKGRKQLLVNPDLSLTDDKRSRGKIALYWRRDEPATTRVRLPGDEWDLIYDLSDESDCGMLLSDLKY